MSKHEKGTCVDIWCMSNIMTAGRAYMLIQSDKMLEGWEERI